MFLQRQNTLVSTGSSGGGDHEPKSSKAAGSHGGNGKAKARSPSGGGGSGGINCNTNKSSDSGRGSGAGSSHGGTVADSPISSPDVTGECPLLRLTLCSFTSTFSLSPMPRSRAHAPPPPCQRLVDQHEDPVRV